MIQIDGYCKFCGKELEGKRSTKTFCNSSCRAQYSALPDRIESAAYYAQQYIAQLKALVERHPEFTEHARPMIESIAENAQKARPRKAYTKKVNNGG